MTAGSPMEGPTATGTEGRRLGPPGPLAWLDDSWLMCVCVRVCVCPTIVDVPVLLPIRSATMQVPFSSHQRPSAPGPQPSGQVFIAIHPNDAATLNLSSPTPTPPSFHSPISEYTHTHISLRCPTPSLSSHPVHPMHPCHSVTAQAWSKHRCTSVGVSACLRVGVMTIPSGWPTWLALATTKATTSRGGTQDALQVE